MKKEGGSARRVVNDSRMRMGRRGGWKRQKAVLFLLGARRFIMHLISVDRFVVSRVAPQAPLNGPIAAAGRVEVTGKTRPVVRSGVHQIVGCASISLPLRVGAALTHDTVKPRDATWEQGRVHVRRAVGPVAQVTIGDLDPTRVVEGAVE